MRITIVWKNNLLTKIKLCLLYLLSRKKVLIYFNNGDWNNKTILIKKITHQTSFPSSSLYKCNYLHENHSVSKSLLYCHMAHAHCARIHDWLSKKITTDWIIERY